METAKAKSEITETVSEVALSQLPDGYDILVAITQGSINEQWSELSKTAIIKSRLVSTQQPGFSCYASFRANSYPALLFQMALTARETGVL